MKLIKNAILAGGMLLASQMAFGGNVLWTNATGDNKWSTSGNWRDNQKPVVDDVVYTSNTVAGAVIWVDEPVNVKSIRLDGTEDLTFYGETIILTSDFSLSATSDNYINYATSRAGFLGYLSGGIVSNEVIFTSTGNTGIILGKKGATFCGPVSAPSATDFRIHNGMTNEPLFPNQSFSATLTFKNGFSAPNATINPYQYLMSEVWFYGPVAVKQFCTREWTNIRYVLASDDIVVTSGDFPIRYNSSMAAGCAAAFPANMVANPISSSSSSTSFVLGLNLRGYDQTIDRLEGDLALALPEKSWAAVRSTTGVTDGNAVPATLTLRGTASAVTPMMIADPVSLVWDPVGDCTQTFSNRAHTTTGTLTVKGGAMCLKGATTFASVPLVMVKAGARLEVETTGGAVFGDAAVLDVKGTLRVAEGAQLFSAGKGEINVGGGKVVLPANAAISIARLKVKGVPQPAATYTTGDAGVDWLEGDGASVTVTEAPVGSYWAAPTDGNWGTAAAWQPVGVPMADANITADTEDFTVTVAAAAGTVEGLKIANADRTTTLSVANSLTVTRPLFDIGRGAVVDVPEGGALTFDAGTYTTQDELTVRRVNIHDGGELRVSGGTFETTAFNGGWDVRTGGKITVSSGKLDFWMEGVSEPFSWATKSTGLRIYDGCSLVVTGGVLEATSTGWNPTPFIALFGGSALFGKTAELQLNQTGGGYFTLFGSGKTRFENSAKFTTMVPSLNNFLYLAATQSGVLLEIDFVDQTKFTGPQQVFLGSYTSGLPGTKMRYASDQTSYMAANYMAVGADFGDSELNLESGTILLGGGGLHLGTWGKPDNVTWTAHKASGTVNMTGGTIDINNGGGIGGFINGLIVGDGSSIYNNEASLKSTFAGTLNISGGTITHSKGSNLNYPYLIVGIGQAEGTINQTGGTISFKPSVYWTSPVFAVIGMGGAKGAWKMSGGTVELSNELYLGGCTVGKDGAFGHDVPLFANTHVYPGAGRHDAVGLLSLSGGTFSVGKDLIVSEDGTGTLELKPGAKLTVGGNLDARVGSKLVIDARGYSGKSQTLATFGGTTQGFAAANIDFKHDGNLRLSVTDTRIRLLGDLGMTLIIR